MSHIKRFFLITLVLIMISFVSYQPVQGQIIPLNLLKEVETILYGQPLNLPIVQRIENIEYTLYNQKGKGSLQERADRVISFVLGDEEKPSLLFLINTLEWTLSNGISQGSILSRLDELESIVFGKVQEGNMAERITHLAELTLPDGKLPTRKVEVPKYTVIKLKLLSEVNSGNLHVGEKIGFEVTTDVKVDNSLVIPAGTRGELVAVEVENAGQFGKSGEVKLKLSSINTIDGTPIPVELYQPEDDNLNQKLAIGASLLGTVILSNPVGLVVGYFVKGREKVIPAGTEFTIKTTQPESVYGLRLY